MVDEMFCGNCFSSFEREAAGRCPYCGYDPAQDTGAYPLALPKGTVLNKRFLTGRVLGQGGFGITYIVKDILTGQRAALKEYLPGTMAVRKDKYRVSAYSGWQGAGFSYGRACFLKEAQTLAEFNIHPNIVHIFSYFEENGTAYFAMDYVEGIRFQDYIHTRGGRLEWEEALYLLLPVMDALEAVHEKGIIHRDVTPDNIFVTEQGHVKLLDFGAARYSLGDRSQSLDVVLKHGFAPKEQYAKRGRQGPYTDIYTLAATFYYAVTGKIPPDAIERIEEDSLRTPAEENVFLPQEIEKALLKALAVHPDKRYQSIAAFRAALVDDIKADENGIQSAAQKAWQRTVLLDTAKQVSLAGGKTGGEEVQQYAPLPDCVEPGGNLPDRAEPEENNSSSIKHNIKHNFKYRKKPLFHFQRLAHVFGICFILCLMICLTWKTVRSPYDVEKNPIISKIAAIFGSIRDQSENFLRLNFFHTVSSQNSTQKPKKTEKADGRHSLSEKQGSGQKEGFAKKLQEGNAMGNIAEDGMAVEDDRYRFYTTVNGLLQIEKASGTMRIVDASYADNLNLWEDWLYYIAEGNICRIRTDGSCRQTVAADGREYSSMYIADGIAYLAYEKNPGSYSYTLLYADTADWKIKELLSGLSLKGYMIREGWLYYRDGQDHYFYKKRLHGTGKKNKVLLSKTYLNSPVYAEGWIYGYTPHNSICAVAADGNMREITVKKNISFSISGLNIENKTIYFYSGYQREEKGKIGSVRLDGTGYEELYSAEKAGDYFCSLNLCKGEMTAAYCKADRMTGTVSIYMKTGRQAVY